MTDAASDAGKSSSRRRSRPGAKWAKNAENAVDNVSQVGVDGALRARAVATPSAQDLLAAERDVIIVRRNWQAPS